MLRFFFLQWHRAPSGELHCSFPRWRSPCLVSALLHLPGPRLPLCVSRRIECIQWPCGWSFGMPRRRRETHLPMPHFSSNFFFRFSLIFLFTTWTCLFAWGCRGAEKVLIILSFSHHFIILFCRIRSCFLWRWRSGCRGDILLTFTWIWLCLPRWLSIRTLLRPISWSSNCHGSEASVTGGRWQFSIMSTPHFAKGSAPKMGHRGAGGWLKACENLWHLPHFLATSWASLLIVGHKYICFKAFCIRDCFTEWLPHIPPWISQRTLMVLGLSRHQSIGWENPLYYRTSPRMMY